MPNTIFGVDIIDVPVRGAFILVDKEPVYDQNGNQVATAADGSFSLEVPIGMHEISVVKDAHTFVSDVWNSQIMYPLWRMKILLRQKQEEFIILLKIYKD